MQTVFFSLSRRNLSVNAEISFFSADDINHTSVFITNSSRTIKIRAFHWLTGSILGQHSSLKVTEESRAFALTSANG